MVTEAQKRAQKKWDATNTRQIKFKLSIKSDSDVLAKLDRVENRTAYLRQLVRADIEKEKK